MNKFFHCKCTMLATPKAVVPFLAKPNHWKKGHSAFELAHSWIPANDVPGRVRDVLKTCAAFRDAVLLQGLFEHETDLRSAGEPTHTDLLALLRLSNGNLGVIAVEGKAGESFGPVIEDWLREPKEKNPGKERRLQTLCEYFSIDMGAATKLRYQLLHRTAAAMFEAERFGATQAITLIHSFAESDNDFQDYLAFLRALGFQPAGYDAVTEGRKIRDIELRFAWVKDRPSADELNK